MKASELRIGNLIKACGLYEGEIVEVEQIGSKAALNEVLRVILFKGLHAGEFIKDCEPVPLTEEWLIKFGFESPLGQIEGMIDEKYFFGRFIIENGISAITNNGYSFRISTDKNHSTHVASIKYVHQLQNLYFAVTGEEFEMNNPTVK